MNFSFIPGDEEEDDQKVSKKIKYTILLAEEEFDFGVEPFSIGSKSLALSLPKETVDLSYRDHKDP